MQPLTRLTDRRDIMQHLTFENEFHSLRMMRRRLTVAMLAVEQFCRKFVSHPRPSACAPSPPMR
ncbi:MAG: hypothetical protein ACR2M3_09525 [Thermomicrobiales bacterium]